MSCPGSRASLRPADSEAGAPNTTSWGPRSSCDLWPTGTSRPAGSLQVLRRSMGRSEGRHPVRYSLDTWGSTAAWTRGGGSAAAWTHGGSIAAWTRGEHRTRVLVWRSLGLNPWASQFLSLSFGLVLPLGSFTHPMWPTWQVAQVWCLEQQNCSLRSGGPASRVVSPGQSQAP